jgi:hypothetical protein
VTDRILDHFLRRQEADGLALAAASDLIDLTPMSPSRNRYIARFTCRGLVRDSAGEIVEAGEFFVGIWFPDDYLRVADPFRVLTWLGPRTIWHPNIAADAPLICVGRLTPGTGLVDILYQVFDIITWRKVTTREDDALNRDACEWARRHPWRRPVDTRPLKRRALTLSLTDIPDGGSQCP